MYFCEMYCSGNRCKKVRMNIHERCWRKKALKLLIDKGHNPEYLKDCPAFIHQRHEGSYQFAGLVGLEQLLVQEGLMDKNKMKGIYK